jgi:hypothetical protein
MHVSRLGFWKCDLAIWPQSRPESLGTLGQSNRGRGLGKTFAEALHVSLGRIFGSFGAENVTRGSHLEKLCLIAKR